MAKSISENQGLIKNAIFAPQTSLKLKAIKTKIIIIYLLNVVDIIFTLCYMETGCFVELNPAMKNIVSNTASALVCKCAIPALLFSYLYLRLKKANDKQIKISNRVFAVLLCMYALINILHIYSFVVYKHYGIL